MKTPIRLLLLLLLLTTASTYSCASTSHENAHHTKLSKAMDKASDHNEGNRRIETETSTPTFLTSPIASANKPIKSIAKPVSPSDAPPVCAPPKTQPTVTNVSLGYGVTDDDDIKQLNHLEVALGQYIDEKLRVEGFIGAGSASIDESVELDSAISNAWIFSLGARIKQFSKPRDTMLGHYFTFGISYSFLYWAYENTIQLDDKNIRNDSLEGIELSAGMGFHLAQTSRYQVGLEILPSLFLWSDDTHEGFENDVFGPLYMLKFRLTFSYLK